MRKIAFTDLHGCNKTFLTLLEQVTPEFGDQLFFLGDYIDRGPDSKGVIDEIISLQERGYEVQCLRGNHEQMLLDCLQNPQDLYFWLANGGAETMASFQANRIEEIPGHYLEWFEQLAYYLEVDEYILVHAGLNFKKENPFEDLESMLWIREWYEDINHDWLQDRIIIHGHTPVSTSMVKFYLKNLERQRVS